MEVIRSEISRVPEPTGANYIIMTPLMQRRIGTNIQEYQDNIIVGSISENTLTVTSITQGALSNGLLLIDSNYPTMNILPNTQIISQEGGVPGGIGIYQLNNIQTLSSETLYAGLREDIEAVEWTVQLDFHGPLSADNMRVFEQLFRSDYGVDQFNTILVANGLSNYEISPLYTSEPRQAPFENAEQQIEFRWSLDACMMIVPATGVPQQFATQIKVAVIDAGANTT